MVLANKSPILILGTGLIVDIDHSEEEDSGNYED